MIFVTISCFLLCFIVFYIWKYNKNSRKGQLPTCTLVVLGSGGHTAEICALLSLMDPQRYTPRSYVVATTDRMGAQKAQNIEQQLSAKLLISSEEESSVAAVKQSAEIIRISRSREVGQSYLTSILSTSLAAVEAFRIVVRAKPDLVLVNGPGTCIPICLAAILCRPFSSWRGKIVYLESIARVSSLSLTGTILYKLRLADLFFVQWPELQSRFHRSMYCGRLF